MGGDSVAHTYWFRLYSSLNYRHIDWQSTGEYKGSMWNVYKETTGDYTLIKDYDMIMDVKLVNSEQNKATEVTRFLK